MSLKVIIMKKKILITLTFIILTFAVIRIALGMFQSAENSSNPTPQTIKVKKENFQIISYGTGYLEAVNTATMFFSTTGVLVDIPVKLGDTVSTGDILAVLEDKEKQILLQKAIINLEELTAQSNISQTEIDVFEAFQSLEEAESNLNLVIAGPDIDYYRQQLNLANEAYQEAVAKLEKVKSPSVQMYTAVENARLLVEQTQLDLDNALSYIVPEEDIQRALAEVNLAKTNYLTQKTLLDYLQGLPIETMENPFYSASLIEIINAEKYLEVSKQNLNETVLISPMTGTITSINSQVGTSITSNTSIMTITNTDDYTLRFYVDESELATISLNDAVNITLQSFPELVLTGHIIKIDPSLVEEDGVKKIQAWASFDDGLLDIQFFNGAIAEVEVIAVEEKDVILVPYQALLKTESGTHQVVVINNGIPEFRNVTVGISDFANAIIESGLSIGEIVSTNPITYIEDQS
ncbi:MAG: hypothetical protein CL609_09960 [Anaerolineaceae bacterium]|nr:hypothetical protein [Anaerolineaceae bacterium]